MDFAPYMSLTCFLLKVQPTTSGIKIAYSYIILEQITACIFFRHIGVKLWNDLPHHVKSITDIFVFKEFLYQNFTGFKCRCSLCNFK